MSATARSGASTPAQAPTDAGWGAAGRRCSRSHQSRAPGSPDGPATASTCAASLAALLAKNHTWQCPTLVWERGGNLLDVSDFSGDSRIKYVPGPWKKKTWKRFTEEITQGYGTDDIATRKKFIEKEQEVVRMLPQA